MPGRGKWHIKAYPVSDSLRLDGLYFTYPPVPDPSPTDVVERRLSRIETRIHAAWHRLRRTLERRTVRLPPKTEGLLKQHVWLQLTRTPQFFERIRAGIRYGRPEIDRAVARVEAAGGRIAEADRRAIEDGSMLENCMQNALASSVITQDVQSLSWRLLMEQRRLVVGRAVNNVRFVISDHPVMYCNSVPGTGSTLANPHLQVWTPISPRYALGLVHPSGTLRPGAVVSLGSDRVREWNEWLFRHCVVCAGRTLADLSFLVSRCGH